MCQYAFAIKPIGMQPRVTAQEKFKIIVTSSVVLFLLFQHVATLNSNQFCRSLYSLFGLASYVKKHRDKFCQLQSK